MRNWTEKNIAAPLAVEGRAGQWPGHLKYTPEQLQALIGSFVGRIVVPHDPHYGEARLLFAPTFQRFPQIICYCTIESDVVRAIAFAHEVGLSPVCRSGGHSSGGFSANDEMIIDMTGIAHVLVDKDARRVRIGGGAKFAAINAMLDLHGVNMPGGACSSVAIGGYSQGGGYGFTAQMFGMNCDCMRRARLVLADGSIVEASEHENSDLFWAIRGGTGNNFGVLIEAEFEVFEIGDLLGFGIMWPLETEEQREVALRAMTIWHGHLTGENTPEKLGNQGIFANIKGTPFFGIRGMYDGGDDELKAILAAFDGTLGDDKGKADIWKRASYEYLNNYLLAYPVELPSIPMSARSLGSSRIMGPDLDENGWRRILDVFLESPSQTNVFGLEAYGGAINRVERDATAFFHRRASFDLFVYSFWIYAHEEDAARAYIDRFERELTPISTGHAYQNYPNPAERNYRELFWGNNFSRLLEIKKRYDPHMFFRFPQCIREQEA